LALNHDAVALWRKLIVESGSFGMPMWTDWERPGTKETLLSFCGSVMMGVANANPGGSNSRVSSFLSCAAETEALAEIPQEGNQS
jgi:hypothetical protein